MSSRGVLRPRPPRTSRSRRRGGRSVRGRVRPRVDPEGHGLLVLSAAERFVVRLHLFGVGDLERRDDARVCGVQHGRFAVGRPDDVPVGDVAVHALGVKRAVGHVEEYNAMMSAVLYFILVSTSEKSRPSLGCLLDHKTLIRKLTSTSVSIVVSIFPLCSYYSIAFRDDDENISSGAWGDHLSFLRRPSFWDFIHLAQDRFARLVGTPLRRDCPRGADITS